MTKMNIKYSKQTIALLTLLGLLSLAPSARAGVPVTIVGDLQIRPFIERLEHQEKYTEFLMREAALPVIVSIILNGIADSDLWVKDWSDHLFGEAQRQYQASLDDFFQGYTTDDGGTPDSVVKAKRGLEQRLYKQESKPTLYEAEDVFNSSKPERPYETFLEFTQRNSYTLGVQAQVEADEAAKKATLMQQTIGVAGQGYLGETKGPEIVSPAKNIGEIAQRALDNQIERSLTADNCWGIAGGMVDAISSLVFDEGMMTGGRSSVGEGLSGLGGGFLSGKICEFLGGLGI